MCICDAHLRHQQYFGSISATLGFHRQSGELSDTLEPEDSLGHGRELETPAPSPAERSQGLG